MLFSLELFSCFLWVISFHSLSCNAFSSLALLLSHVISFSLLYPPHFTWYLILLMNSSCALFSSCVISSPPTLLVWSLFTSSLEISSCWSLLLLIFVWLLLSHPSYHIFYFDLQVFTISMLKLFWFLYVNSSCKFLFIHTEITY